MSTYVEIFLNLFHDTTDVLLKKVDVRNFVCIVSSELAAAFLGLKFQGQPDFMASLLEVLAINQGR